MKRRTLIRGLAGAAVLPGSAATVRLFPGQRIRPDGTAGSDRGVPLLRSSKAFAAMYPNARMVVEMAWGADLTADSSTWSWVDITADLLQGEGQTISISPMGRSDNTSKTQPAACSFQVGANNSAIKYMRGPQSPNYPNVHQNIPLRVWVTLSGRPVDMQIQFWGEAWSMKPTWNKRGNVALVTIKAGGKMRQLQQGTAPLRSALYRAVATSENLVSYWSCEEGADANRVSSAVGGPPLDITGSVAFAAADGPAGSGRVLSCTGGGRLAASIPVNSSTTWQWEAWVAIDTSGGVLQPILAWTTTGSVNYWELRADASGIYVETLAGATDTTTTVFGLATNPFRNNTDVHHVRVRSVPTGPYVQVFVDDVLNDIPLDMTGLTSGYITGMTVNPVSLSGSATNTHLLSFGHLAVWSSPPLISTSDAGAGYAGEMGDVRLARLCTEQGVPVDIRYGFVLEDFRDDAYVVAISGTWTRDPGGVLRSAVIGDSSQSDAVVGVPAGATDMTFTYKVSSEFGFDFFTVLVDGVARFSDSGDVGFVSKTLSVIGASTVTFRYSKDSSTSVGDDAAKIRNLAFTTNSTPMGPQGINTFLELLREVEAANLGVLGDGLGPGLFFVGRAARYNQPVSMALDATTGKDLADSPAPEDDDQKLRNRYVVKRKNGSQAIFEDTDGPLGTATVGTYESTPGSDLNLATDGPLYNIAAFLTGLGTVDGYRYPKLPIDMRLVPRIAGAWASLRPGGRFTVDNVASVSPEHPINQIDLLAEGWSQQLSPHAWLAVLNCEWALPWNVAALGVNFRLELAGVTLAADLAPGATTFTVAVGTGHSLLSLKATYPADYPADLDVGGWPVHVTDCTGASTPQTLSCDPTPNTYVIPAGTTVKLYRPAGLAL